MKLSHVILHEALRDHAGRTSYTFPAANTADHRNYLIELATVDGVQILRLSEPGVKNTAFPHGFERISPASNVKEATPVKAAPSDIPGQGAKK